MSNNITMLDPLTFTFTDFDGEKYTVDFECGCVHIKGDVEEIIMGSQGFKQLNKIYKMRKAYLKENLVAEY